MSSLFRLLFSISLIKTLRVNFYYLPFSQAIKIPIFLSRSTYLRKLKGRIKFSVPIVPGMIRFGFNTCGVVDYGNDRAIWEVGGEIEFHGNVSFGAATRLIIMEGGKMIVGKEFSITGRTCIICAHNIILGNDCIISWDVQIMDTDFHSIYSLEEIINEDRAINISDNVWIGSRCTILKGANIPNGCVVAANSLVVGKLQYENSIYGGIPAKVLKTNIIWRR